MSKKVRKKQTQKMIKDQIKSIIIRMLAVALLLVGVISSALNLATMQMTLQKSMSETAQVAANQVLYNLGEIMNPVEVIGSIARLTSDSNTPEEKQALLDGYVKNYGWESLRITDKEGNVMNTSVSVGGEDYFKEALAGTTTVSEPFYDDEAGKLVVVAAAPLWKAGLINTEVAGVIFAKVDAVEFTDLVATIKVSDNGAAYIIDTEGNTIAHANIALVESKSNTIKDAETDSNLKQLAKLEQDMINGNSGFGSYTYGGVTKFMAYSPVGINNWSIAITAPVNDFISSTVLGVVVTVVLLIVTLAVGVGLANKYGTKIGGAVNVCANRLQLLAKGDLETDIPVVDTEDETKILADSTAAIVKTQQSIIGDMKHLLTEMSVGNFAVRSQIGVEAYVGAYTEMLNVMRILRDEMAKALRSIAEVSAQVETGSVQLANAAQELAEGATEQAGTVEELLNTVTDVTAQVEKNHEAADMAHEKVKEIGVEANVSETKMKDLTAEMKNIEDTSAEIRNIIGEIEEIASQTNLLALNASIEAARAGDAGRGFAVVADQIGKLAEQSAQSAVNTRHLIESSIQEVNKGSIITTETAEHVEKMMRGLDEMMLVIAQVRDASDSQTRAIGAIKEEVNQISAVVQSNSAAAEETSATSEELSAQAQTMEALVAKFSLPAQE